MPAGKRQQFRSSQDVDPEKSYSLEDEGATRGYYIGLFGIIFKWSLGFMFIILLLAAQDVDQPTFVLIVIMATIYIFGWITTRSAGLKEIAAYETIGDVIAFGVFFGFVIRVTEGIVWMISAELLGIITEVGAFGIDRMSPFIPLANSAFAQELAVNNPLMAGGYVLVAVGLIVAAVAEELFYRGSMIYGIDWMTDKRGFGDDTAKGSMLLLQAAIFALLHALVYGQWAQIIALFAGGIIFGLLFLWKKDLSVPIIAHVTLNLTSLSGVAQEYLLENPIYIVMIIAGVILMIYFIVTRRSGKMDELERGKHNE